MVCIQVGVSVAWSRETRVEVGRDGGARDTPEVGLAKMANVLESEETNGKNPWLLAPALQPEELS